MDAHQCRFCRAPLTRTLVDLGVSPLCESFLRADQLDAMEPFYPLHVFVCEQCLLVQLAEYVQPGAIFSDYAYFSSYSDSWLDHARRYTTMAVDRFTLDGSSLVLEVASNDGYLLQYFVQQQIPVLGIEPALNVAAVAREKQVPTLGAFFSQALAQRLVAEGKRADLTVCNNVLAHVPDLHDFVAGLQTVLKPAGTITMEFPHLLRLLAEHQFDTIYHEHFSYFSAFTAQAVFAAHGLTVFDLEELPTHGGSLRLYVRHQEDTSRAVTERVRDMLAVERAAGLTSLEGHLGFEAKVEATKRDLLAFLIGAKRVGRSVVGYGAPGKGNTLLNYCGIRTDLLDFTVDRSPYKQGLYTPGTHIPIFAPEQIRQARPDYVLILPWNLKDEIMRQHAYIAGWGGRFVVPIPLLTIFALGAGVPGRGGKEVDQANDRPHAA